MPPALTGLDFTAIDFETANSSSASVCAVGAVRVRNGVIVEEFTTLVTPPERFSTFSPGNIRIHGITAEKIASAQAPTWNTVYPKLLDFIGTDTIVGHNVQFDISVLINATGEFDLPWPEFNSVCTLALSRAALQLPSYSLPWVVDHLGIPIFNHHDAVSDARASAQILIAIAKKDELITLNELLDSYSILPVPTFADDSIGDSLPPNSGDSTPVSGIGFTGETVCFTGALTHMIRNDAQRQVEEHGGTPKEGISKKVTILVTGDFDPRTFRPGAKFSSKLQKAFDLEKNGHPIEIITEDEFVSRLSLSTEELQIQQSRRRVQGKKLPDWVITQSGDGPDGDYWAWFAATLKHPDGRATPESGCIWCSTLISKSAHWIHRDRHVCSVHCNERLKRSARGAWDRMGIPRPQIDSFWT
ncbi:MAG: exonuclease domain-containing protein [Mycetocola sp.]